MIIKFLGIYSLFVMVITLIVYFNESAKDKQDILIALFLFLPVITYIALTVV